MSDAYSQFGYGPLGYRDSLYGDYSEYERRIRIAEKAGWTDCYASNGYLTGIDPDGIERYIPEFNDPDNENQKKEQS